MKVLPHLCLCLHLRVFLVMLSVLSVLVVLLSTLLVVLFAVMLALVRLLSCLRASLKLVHVIDRARMKILASASMD